MTMNRNELTDAAAQAFGGVGLMPDARANWATLSEMGWFMMAVPEAQGGLGLGLEAAGVIHTALGKVLAPGPAIAQMLAIEALIAADDRELLECAVAGEVVTLSLETPHADDQLRAVPDADQARYVIVDQGDRIRKIPIDQCRVTPSGFWDETRRLFNVTLPAQDIGTDLSSGIQACALSERLQSRLLFMLAADSLGGAEAALMMTIDHLKIRRQYDRPIAMFQALKHRVADLKTMLSAAQALFWTRVSGDVSLAEMGALKAHCTAVYCQIAQEAIQLHGGIGLTQEHPCHLFLKRAMLNAALGGDNDNWNEAVGRSLLENTSRHPQRMEEY